ncbi:hypothetical protein B5180_31875 [Streptomyces sp. BF-3]|nr:hypothetical protein B5180_31875 [Streptomyces sp. BF-3]
MARPAQPRFTWHHFTMLFSSTPRGARLARYLAGERLDTWGVPYGTADQEGGRGLLLVAALADDWGWFPRTDGPGKTVWASLDVRPL